MYGGVDLRYEAEFFQQQLAMEADKATAMAQARQLQVRTTLVCIYAAALAQFSLA
jgi:hypothetical protein